MVPQPEMPRPHRCEGRRPCLWRQPSKYNKQAKLLPAAKQGGCPVGAGVTWGKCFARLSFLFGKLEEHLQSCLKDPGTYYLFTVNIKTHEFVFAHKRCSFRC